MKSLNLAISTCPNDTFIFSALLSGLVKSEIDLTVVMDDVEQLNHFIVNKKLQHAPTYILPAGRELVGDVDISKISYGVVSEILDEYALLPAGGALGFGVGPLLVAKADTEGLPNGKIAVPGLHTTAFKVFKTFYPALADKCEPVRFDRIMPLVQEGEYAMGLIIHEGRFTYGNYGLRKVADMGELWMDRYSSPLPLGAIAMKRSLASLAPVVNELICQSVQYAWSNPANIMPFVERYSDEMDADVMKSHIELYVNKYSVDATPAVDGIADFLGVSPESVFFKL
ncbi:MAG: 1,4-dihydroxy-6-naphthoate synthase [Deferribacteraceae bacterium]|jgi:1,4-dihydroxy-6-naphthoate synthase|nr:1,4-dihydroxy-6-naphthoate synthase [Deferribacteraceae bacterium]